MSEALHIAIEPRDEAVEQAIAAGLREFNRDRANWPERQHFNVVLRDAEGRVQGGLIASVNFDVLRIDEVFIVENWRHGGFGKLLVELAEQEGMRRGARLASVTTFSWQARPFYEKLGYAVFAELPYDDGAQTLFWLKKPLCV